METFSTSNSPLSARDRIVQTAHRLFYSEGIRATGINRVIEEAGVTKVTFYRHFPSKNNLILEFLEYRHRLWMTWFATALRRHGDDIQALIPTLGEWFRNTQFRGCTFINSVGELGGELPEVKDVTRRHKQEMAAIIAALLPEGEDATDDAQAIALAVDGAIVHAQFDLTPDAALQAFGRVVQAIAAK